MYADRFDARRGLRPRSLALAIAINGAVVLAIATAQPDMVQTLINHPFEAYPVPKPLDPKPLPPPKLDPRPARRSHITTTERTVDPLPTHHDDFVVPLNPLPSGGTGTSLGDLGGGGTVVEPPVKPPLLVDSAIDQRFARDLQPPYPPSERKMGREGRVVVRVLVGADGRVHDVQLVNATSDDFFDVTRRQAFAKWRFRPATRDGVAEESWRRMTVSFRLDDE